MNILFVCDMAKNRSKTASDLNFGKDCQSNYAGINGGHPYHNIDSNYHLLKWADIIVCMEEKHKAYIGYESPEFYYKCQVWKIPDKYDYMDDVLITRLRGLFEKYILRENYATEATPRKCNLHAKRDIKEK